MRRSRVLAKAAATAALAGLLAAGYLLVARPYQMHWGATAAEAARPMPGDALSRNPTFLATRAITIDGTPEEIWPWLVQMGYGRAGFYGYDILENLGSPRGLRSADTIASDLQHLAVGDPLPLSALGGLVVHAVAPDAYLVWAGPSGEYPAPSPGLCIHSMPGARAWSAASNGVTTGARRSPSRSTRLLSSRTASPSARFCRG